MHGGDIFAWFVRMLRYVHVCMAAARGKRIRSPSGGFCDRTDRERAVVSDVNVKDAFATTRRH